MPDVDPVQAQLIAVRRAQILDAATKVFAEKGFHSATIKDVARAAGIADGTIYIYFKNKTALLMGLLDRLNETPQRPVDFDRASQMELADWVHMYVTQRMDTLGQDGLRVLQIMISESMVNKDLRDAYRDQIMEPTFDMAEKFFERWIAAGRIKPFDPALAVRTSAAMTIGLLVLNLLGDSQVQTRWDECAAIVSEVLLNGMVRRDGDEPAK